MAIKSVRVLPSKGEEVNSVDKFGKNSDVGAGEFIWPYAIQPTEESTAKTLYISSTHAGDTDVIITVEYIDADGNHATVTQALDGSDSTTFVSLGVTGLFVNRAYVDDENITLNGDVYVSSDNTDAGGDGIPDTASDVKAVIPIAHNQTMQAFYLVPANRTLFLIGWSLTGSKDAGTGRTGIMQLTHLPDGGSWRTIETMGFDTDAPTPTPKLFPFAKKYSGGTLIGIKCESVSGANAEIDAQFYGWLE